MRHTEKLLKQPRPTQQRRQSIHADPIRPVLRRQAPRGVRHDGFAAVVPDQARARAFGADGRDVDDGTAAGAAQGGDYGRDGVEDGFDVDGEDAVEVGRGYVQGGFVFVGPAGVVDEDVEAAPSGVMLALILPEGWRILEDVLVFEFTHGSLPLAFAGNVELHDVCGVLLLASVNCSSLAHNDGGA